MSVRLVTFGCRLNTYESAAIEALPDLPDDLIVVNTCAVTGEAERQCRQAIRKLRRENPDAFLVVAGCAAQVHPELYAQMPEVDRVLGNREKLKAESFAPAAPSVQVGDMQASFEEEFSAPVCFDGRCRAFIRIQQGCDNRCTYCIVPQARGKSVYTDKAAVLEQARALVAKGFTEIGLTGVDITDYPDFAGLVGALCETEGLKRLRLGSIDPASVSDDLIRLFGESDVLMPHLHLSVQSGDDTVLKRMGRRHSRGTVLSLCEKVRAVRPDAVFGADFITGFPTETDAMFDNTAALVREARLTHLHVFPYSERSGTPAAKMPQVPVRVRRERAKILRETGDAVLSAYMESRVGQTAVVLTETAEKGLCEHYLSVKIDRPSPVGAYVPVRLTGICETGVYTGSVL